MVHQYKFEDVGFHIPVKSRIRARAVKPLMIGFLDMIKNSIVLHFIIYKLNRTAWVF